MTIREYDRRQYTEIRPAGVQVGDTADVTLLESGYRSRNETDSTLVRVVRIEQIPAEESPAGKHNVIHCSNGQAYPSFSERRPIYLRPVEE